MTAARQISRRSLLAQAAPGAREGRLAFLAIVASVLCFAAIAPFAGLRLPSVPAFIPASEAALAICDLLTSVLLLSQFLQLRRVSVLVVSCAYLYNTCLIISHVLTFPDVFSPTGLLGSGSQTTSWLYVFWHAGFASFLLAYGLLANSSRDALPQSIGTARAALTGIGGVLLLAIGLTLLTTLGHDLLPTVLEASNYSRLATTGISPGILAVTALAVLIMWRRRRQSVLDVWLFAVLWVWLCDVSLSSVVGSVRYSLGWYGGRVFGVMAASFVLGSLLMEMNKLYGRLADALIEAEAKNVELVQSRNELARVQRLDAIGQLTGGIAHDFNNLLTAVIGSLDIIKRQPHDAQLVARVANGALKAAERGARLVSQLMMFARKRPLNPTILNPNAILLEFESLASRAAGESIELEFHLEPGVHPVECDATEFQAAVLNLITNARDAMPRGGTVHIASQNTELADGVIADLPGGRYVMISVADTGEGMSATTRARVFEPFFTTKDVGKGTGLGLSQVYGFVTSAHGHVDIESTPGGGTTVRLYLPRSSESRHAATADGAVPLRRAGPGEAVLLVEDDPDVVTATRESLVELGYQVITATAASEALMVLEGEQRVDVLFSDVVMPGGMNGVQLAVAARRLRPGLKVLLTSGYAEGVLRGPQAVPADLPLIGKPYRREELAERLRIVLGAG